ncbi:MAG: low specificity L-threonine aldolase [Sphaerochaeta sp.]|nr:low specificity L-threonine aldolase [Sphaerochaeta sp.]
MKRYDLRSDTITKPTEGMRKAMYQAEVGDDVYREDPTTTRLEVLAAQLSGKEKALFISSGSMGNLISLYLNGGRSNEVLTSMNSHILHHEIGSVASIAGVLPIAIEAPRGVLSAANLQGKVKGGEYDMATTTLVEVENTIGGYCYPLENLEGIRDFADTHGLKVHMDGARIFNAQQAMGIPVKTYAKYADTLTFCLSKGLGCPVGSLLCGDEAFINKALTVRKILGGGMRQTGILAAAGLYALEHHVDRLNDDHRRAKAIAKALEESDWARVDMEGVQTNVIFFTVPGFNTNEVIKELAEVGILANHEGPIVRLVTNLDLSEEDSDEVCSLLKAFKPRKLS